MNQSAVNTLAHACLASRVRLLNRLVTGIYDQALRPHGLRISQVNVLVMIAKHGPLRGSEICRVLRLEKSTLSRDLKRMIDRGWITRSSQLQVTPAGLHLLTACIPAWQQAQREARELLTAKVADGVMNVVRDLWLDDDAFK